jgi:hypothetical protein
VAIEEQRLRIRQSLEEKLGVEEASYLMDRPLGGWSDLVTNQTLDLRIQAVERRIDGLESGIGAHLNALRHELLAEIERRSRIQTWAVVSTILAAAGLLGVLERI